MTNGMARFCGKQCQAGDLRVFCNGNLDPDEWPSHGTCGASFIKGFVARQLICTSCARLAGLVW